MVTGKNLKLTHMRFVLKETANSNVITFKIAVNMTNTTLIFCGATSIFLIYRGFCLTTMHVV